MSELRPPTADEVALRALVNDAVRAFNSLIVAACGPRQHLGHLLSDDCRKRLVEGDYLLNTVHDEVTHYWEPLEPSPAH